MSATLFLAIRYLFPRRKLFAFSSNFICVLGIAIGLCAFIIARGVTKGFHQEIKNRLLSLTPHITISSDNIEEVLREISKLKFVLAATIFTSTQGVLKSRMAIQPVVIKGIDYDSEKKVTSFANLIKQGSWTKDSISLGRDLAKLLNVSVGDEVLLLLPTVPHEVIPLPQTVSLRVGSIFSSGIYDYDVSLALLDIGFFKTHITNYRQLIGIKTKNPYKVEEYCHRLEKKFKNAVISSWSRQNRNLFAALKLEEFTSFIIMVLIILVACLNISSNLSLLIKNKIKDLGILYALGVEKSKLSAIFIFFGGIIGIIGIVSGELLGYIVTLLLERYKFIKLPPEVYFIDTIPISLSIMDFLGAFLLALALIGIVIVRPIREVLKLNPIEIIRYG